MNTAMTHRAGCDVETLARAILTFCMDGAEPMMTALIHGAGSAPSAVRLLGGPDLTEPADAVSPPASGLSSTLDHAFIAGTLRWGRAPAARTMEAFHTSVARWQSRLEQLPGRQADSLVAWATADGRYWLLAPHHPLWPQRLHDLEVRTDWAAPLCLWGAGDARVLTACAEPVAIVGSRAATEYGTYVARALAQRVVGAGHVLVSGGAMGIDAAAHWGALSVQRADPSSAGRTVAVFAGGLDHVGPARNLELFDRITHDGGALISELCPGTIPEARRFLLRNRIIAALSATVAVAQAQLRSGALNTVSWACELGRSVVAVPGEIILPANAGCNRLIADQKAALLVSVPDIDTFCHQPHP